VLAVVSPVTGFFHPAPASREKRWRN